MAAASFMSRFLNTTRTAFKFKDIVAYGIKHRAEIVSHATDLLSLLADVYKDPVCQDEFNNARTILHDIGTMSAIDLVKLFNKKGAGLDTLLASKPHPVDFEFFCRIIPSFISWTRVQIKTYGKEGTAMLSALTITANAVQRHLSIIIGHYDAIVSLLHGHRPDSHLISEIFDAARALKFSVEERLVHLRRRLDKTTYDAYGPQAHDQEIQDDGPVFIPVPSEHDMQEIIEHMNASDFDLPIGLESSSSSAPVDPDHASDEEDDSPPPSGTKRISRTDVHIDPSTPEPRKKRQARQSSKRTNKKHK